MTLNGHESRIKFSCHKTILHHPSLSERSHNVTMLSYFCWINTLKLRKKTEAGRSSSPSPLSSVPAEVSRQARLGPGPRSTVCCSGWSHPPPPPPPPPQRGCEPPCRPWWRATPPPCDGPARRCLWRPAQHEREALSEETTGGAFMRSVVLITAAGCSTGRPEQQLFSL